MKNITPTARRAAAGLIPAAALLAIPAFAQEVTPSVAPPPVRATITQTAPPSVTPPVVDTPTQAAPAAVPDGVSRTVISPDARNVVDEARQRPAARTTAPSQRAAAVRRATPRDVAPVAAVPIPVAAAPASAPVQPVDVTPPVETPVETVADAPAPGAAASSVTTSDATTESTGPSLWPIFAILAVGIAAIFGFIAWRRRRDAAMYQEEPYFEGAVSEAEPQPVYVAPTPEPVVERTPVAVPVAAAAGAQSWGLTAPTIRARKPVAAAPSAAAQVQARTAVPVAAPIVAEAPVATAEDASVHAADSDDVASLTTATPVADRPWLEFAMRPIRAGTNSDEALVEIELTVANSGALAAEDVRISTFMLPVGADSEMERLLIGGDTDASIAPTTIEAGEGTRIDATLALLKSDIGSGGRGEDFSPVVFADARYRLPDGSEGRTAAAFRVGTRDDSGALTSFALDDRQMFDDVEADLYGLPRRA